MTVEVENQANGIRIIKLTGASASKSFSRESLPIIANAIDNGLKDSEIKGMVITGEGKFFSAGADIHAFQEAIDANDAPQLIRDLTNILHPLLMRIRESSTIVVAAINGAAAGGGDKTNVEDVFSTYLYKGTGAARGIDNGIALADGEIHSSEIEMIQRISNGIGINHYEFLSMKAMYTQQYSHGGQRSYQSGRQQARKQQGPSLNTCYQILGIASSSTEVELKKAYRKLAVKYHPDKVAHLGQDHVQTAEDKFQKVQEAYEKIKDSRGLN